MCLCEVGETNQDRGRVTMSGISLHKPSIISSTDTHLVPTTRAQSVEPALEGLRKPEFSNDISQTYDAFIHAYT